MLRILAIIGGVVVVAVVGVLVYAATKPDTFRLERTAVIAAAPEEIHPFISDFRQWRAWSPYEELDPALERTYEGPASGTGAVYAWSGNDNVGQGRMEIVEDTPPSMVSIKLDFLRPFEAHNTAEFTLVPDGEATRVTWAMYGPQPYIGKLMSTFVDLDKMVGKDFETGLANLKAAAEQ